MSVLDNVGDQTKTLAALIAAVDPYSGTSPRQKQLAIAAPDDSARRRPTNGASHILPLKPTVVYDTYWRFATERQEMFCRRVSAEPQPWTADPILKEDKFTNVYRASDSVSRYLDPTRHLRRRAALVPRRSFLPDHAVQAVQQIQTWVALERAWAHLRTRTIHSSATTRF